MSVRTARQGPYSGQQFYGCLRYPDCKGIRNIGPAEASPGDPTPPNAPATSGEAVRSVLSPWAIPRQVGMRACLPTNQVVVFQSNQQVEAIVKAVYDDDIDKSVLALSSQWRLDFPRENPRSIHESSARSDTLLSIMEKLLTRGTFSYTTPELEAFIVERSGFSQLPNLHGMGLLESTLRTVAAMPTCPYQPASFDSPEEEQFRDYLMDNIGPEWSLMEQVDFQSLLGPLREGANRRIDFLLTRSDGEAVVIEIDGQQHSESGQADSARDRELASAGLQVVRVPADEVRAGGGPGLTRLHDFNSRPVATGPSNQSLDLAVRLGKLTHQVQVSIVQALRYGWLSPDSPWSIGVDPPSHYHYESLVLEAAQVAAESCAGLIRRVFDLYGESGAPSSVAVELAEDMPAADITISFDRDALPNSTSPVFQVADICFPYAVAAPGTIAEPADVSNPNKAHMEYFLDYIFRKQGFLEGQWECIDRTLRGLDSIVLLPTGGGKSIAFQLSALLRPGCCIVVDPIIALIEDQIDNLGRVGIDRCLEISSQVERTARDVSQVMMQQGHYFFVYVAPERFQMDEFRHALRALVTNAPISLVAVDEAHCVSEWGHDFRTAYLNLSRNAREYCKSPADDSPPPIIALTGTASRMVLKDIQRDLDIAGDFDAVITPQSFDRRELNFLSEMAKKSSETIDLLRGIMESLPKRFRLSPSDFFRRIRSGTYSGIVFTSTVNGPKGTAELANRLRRDIPAKIEHYSGRPPLGVASGTWNDTKRAVSKRFKHDDTQLLVATNAYGMGIDKPNVRYTVHFGLPGSIEAFYQEAGRAGRDRENAFCGIVFSDDDQYRSQHLLNETTSIQVIEQTLKDIPIHQQDDVLQALWFHTQSFKGIDKEAGHLVELVSKLDRIGAGGRQVIGWNSKDRDNANDIEKALHRLVILGIVSDYTKDYSKTQFNIDFGRVTHADIAENIRKYVKEYQTRLANNLQDDLLRLSGQPIRDFTVRAGKRLIGFVYDHVEKSRRRALSEMLEAARSAASSRNSNQILRSRVLRHLEWSEFDDALDAVVTSGHGGLDCVGSVLDQIEAPTAADSLRGAVARLLESYPDQPGLLLIRGVSEALARDANLNVTYENVRSALTNAITTYRIEGKTITDALSKSVNAAKGKEGSGERIVKAIVEHESLDRIMARSLIESILPNLSPPLVAWLARQLSTSADDIHRVHDDKQQH